MMPVALIAVIFSFSYSHAQAGGVPSLYDPNLKNIPAMPKNLEVPQLDNDAIDLYNKCQDAVAAAFPKFKNLNKARCEVYDTVGGCRNVLTCSKTPDPVINPDPKPKPKPSPNPAPSPTPSPKGNTEGPSTSTGDKSGGDTSTPSSATKSSTTSSDEQSDLDRCKNLASTADSACSDSSDDDDNYLSAAGQGLVDACKDLQASGATSAKKSAEKAKACSDAYMSCTQTCSSLAETYNDSDNWSTFNSTSRKCLALESRAKAMRDSSTSSNTASKSGANCFSDSSESPQSASSGKGNSSSSAANAASGSGMNGTDPNQSAQAATPSGGVSDASTVKTNKGLDVGDTSGSTVANPFGSDPYQTQGSGSPQVKPISNNSGGSIPGSGASANAGAANTGGGLMSAVKSTIADIQKGLFGGGGGPTTPEKKPEEETPIFDENGNPLSPQAVAARRSAARKKDSDDLKRYLPGGDLWHRQRGPASIDEINGPGVDLWSRIHNRMIEKCKLGELFDCQLP